MNTRNRRIGKRTGLLGVLTLVGVLAAVVLGLLNVFQAGAVNENFALVGAPYNQTMAQGSVTRTVNLTFTEAVHGYSFKIDYDETLA